MIKRLVRKVEANTTVEAMSPKEFIQICKGKFFKPSQWKIIKQGFEEGLDVPKIQVYADPKFDSSQMEKIKDGLVAGVDVTIYAKPDFSSTQMYWILEGLRNNLDVSLYAKPDFNAEQMRTLMVGLKDGLTADDLKNVAIPSLESNFMSQKIKDIRVKKLHF
jgi:hypothetical protein